jgi:hypothetical protein
MFALDIISSRRFMVSTNSGLFVFDTPNVESSHPAISQSAMPVWEFRFNKNDTMLVPLAKVIRDAPRAHSNGRVIVWTGHKIVTLTACGEGYNLDSYKHNDMRATSLYGEGDISRTFVLGRAKREDNLNVLAVIWREFQ